MSLSDEEGRGEGSGREVKKQVMKERCESQEVQGCVCVSVSVNTSCKVTSGSGRARWTGMCCCV